MIDRRSILGAATGAVAAFGAARPAAATVRSRMLSAADFGVVAGSPDDQSKRLQHAIDSAAAEGALLVIEPGSYRVGGLRVAGPAAISGVRGLTRLISAAGGPVLRIDGGDAVSLTGLRFDGDTRRSIDDGKAGLVEAREVSSLLVRDCRFGAAGTSGLVLEGCNGEIGANRFDALRHAAIFANGSNGLTIAGNDISDIGDNGILVWQPDTREDGTIVSGNRIAGIRAMSGGTGQNGNGVNVFRAGNVQVTGNRIADCAFSGVRNNAGSNCRIAGNSISRTGEVAIYCEFGFEGAVVSDNLLEQVSMGISITNFDHGGRLAVVSGNLVRDVLGPRSLAQTRAVGIAVEADTLVTGNVIENAADAGIGAGWSYALRDVAIAGNLVRNCLTGIIASVARDAGKATISGNTIAGATSGAIVGMDHRTVATGDLALPGADVPANLLIGGNIVL